MGWGDAWAGLSQQAMGFAIDSLRSKEQQKYQAERDEIARRAAEDQERERRRYEERMQAQKMKFEKGIRAEDRAYRSQESELDRSLRREENEADRALRERSIRLQEQYASRSAADASPAGGGLAQPQGANQKDIDAARRMVETLMRQEKLSAAQAEERVAQMFSEEVAQRAFPGRANRIGQAAQTLQGLSQRAGAYFQ